MVEKVSKIKTLHLVRKLLRKVLVDREVFRCVLVSKRSKMASNRESKDVYLKRFLQMKFYRRQFFHQIFTVKSYLPLKTGCPASFTRCEYLCKTSLLRRPIKNLFQSFRVYASVSR